MWLFVVVCCKFYVVSCWAFPAAAGRAFGTRFPIASGELRQSLNP